MRVIVGREASLPDIAVHRAAGSEAARPTIFALLFLLASFAHAQNCGLPQPAFCETFESGPAPMNDRGRGNELSRTRFSSTRFHPSLSTGDGVTFWVWEAELGFLPGEVPGCRSDVTGFLMPTRDTLVCDPSGGPGSAPAQRPPTGVPDRSPQP